MKLIIADDHDLVRDALASLIERDDPASSVLHANNFFDALKLAESHDDVDLVLLDVHMPGMNEIAAVREIATRFPDLPVVLMSGLVREGDVDKGFEMGARGFIPKTMNGKALVSVLKLVLSGARYVPDIMLEKKTPPPKKPAFDLTARELEVLAQLARGLSNKVIARNLKIEESTVKLHLRSLFRKMKVSNRTETVVLAMEHGLLSDS